ncbi:MAG: 3'-5' exonuclease, partial [Bacillota bacterium]|nr:3'-5' exonuclease [Bacillota bacterium]
MRKKKDDKVDLQSEESLKSSRDAGKKLIDGLKKSYFKRSLQVAREDLLDISDDTYYYIDIVEEFVNTFRAEKAREALIDFDDVMHYAIAVLDHEEAAAELREKFEYIFVDEYQDSNELQEIIVQRIARHNNLFMVGDVKQCIYKFRLAEPEIFRNKAQLYNSEDEADSILLKLNSNFRSKIHVTRLVNDVFRKQMGDNYVGEELNGKAPEDKPGFSPRIHLINLEALEDSMVEKSQVEAEQVARILRERLGEKIYDTKAEEWRRLELRDFAVLARGNSTVEAVEQYLNNEGIDAYGEGGGKYFETVEIQVFMNMLRVTENMRQDIPLISVMKSAVFGFTVKELAEIRIAHPEGSFYSAVMSYAGISRGQDPSCDELVDKIGNMVETISLWKKISKTVPLEETIKKLLYDTGYYAYCSGLPVGKQRVSNLRLIADKAASFEKRSHGGLYGFLQYIEAMKDSDIDDSEARIVSENENVVRVMTVHKSKGLEFPVVIFVGASKNIVGKTGEKPITIHRNFGIALRKSNPEEHWHRKTLLQHAIERTKKQENFEEEKRILYVAMTRAKDGIDIVGTIKEDTSIILVGRPKTFLDMVYSAFDDSVDREIIRVGSTACDEDREDEGASESIERTTRDLYQEAENRAKAGIPDEITQEVERRLSYTYPKEADVKPKYSVSELNAKKKEKSTIHHEDKVDRTSADKDIRLKTLQLGVKKTKLTGAEIGTAMHLLMERLDFDKAVLPDGREYIFSTAERLRNSGILSGEAFEAISLDRIAMFFETDIGNRAAGAFADNRLWREQEFILKSKEEGVDTIIQGVIDCFFEENGKLILVDYKNSYIERGRTLDHVANEYREQIDLYTQALEGATGMKVAERYLYLFSIGKAI